MEDIELRKDEKLSIVKTFPDDRDPEILFTYMLPPGVKSLTIYNITMSKKNVKTE